jgi:N,N-dimethylformamidase
VIGSFGLVMGGAGGYEVDHADQSLGTPPHALVLATATGFSDVYQHVVEEVISMNPDQGGTENPLVRGDMVYFEGPKGGAVFSVGSISWCGSLSHHSYHNNVSQITDNVLRRFASAEPILLDSIPQLAKPS